jgi:hypothetical protein
MEKRVIRKSGDMDEVYVQKLAEEFKKSKEALAVIEKRTNDIKKELSDLVDNHGVADDSGNKWVRLGDLQLKRERRVSRNLDLDAVKEWALANGHWEDIKQVIEVVDEDKLLGLAWNDEAVAEQVEQMYVVKEVWAFKA